MPLVSHSARSGSLGALRMTAAFPPGLRTPEHVALAEELGFAHAWLYDSPALYHDVWMTLALSAQGTRRIGLGPAVLVPSLRHPMTNAAAVATLADLAPGRVAVAVGAGFTGRYVLGQRAMRWADVADYVRVLRALLQGDEAEWEGRPIRMMHSPGYAPARPINVSVLIGADGPKGTQVAAELGDGVFSAGLPNTAAAGRRLALLQFGTVFDEGETAESARVVEAAGPGVVVALHAFYERAGADAVDRFPGGPQWREGIEAFDSGRRHLYTHEGHLAELTERDRAALHAGLSSLIPAFTLSGPPDDVRRRIGEYAQQGVTEVCYQPSGPDIERELRAFAVAALEETG